MFYFLTVLTGILVAIMIAINGSLTAHYGLYTATVIIHISGLIVLIGAFILKKEPIPKDLFTRKRILPLIWYTGGAIGFGTTIFNNVAFGKISISAILALGLLGQSLTSIAIDQWGLFEMPKQPFDTKKLIGYSIILGGIILLMTP